MWQIPVPRGGRLLVVQARTYSHRSAHRSEAGSHWLQLHLLHCTPGHHVSFERLVLHLSRAEADALQGYFPLRMRVIVNSA